VNYDRLVSANPNPSETGEVAPRWAAGEVVGTNARRPHVALLLVLIRTTCKPPRLAFSVTGRYDLLGVGLPLTCAPALLCGLQSPEVDVFQAENPSSRG
jgi:hypothetical protein